MESWHSYFSSLGPADDDKSFSELPVLQPLPTKLWPLHEPCIGEEVCSLLELIGGSRFNFRKCVFFIYFVIWKGATCVLCAFENPIQMISCSGSPKSSACTNTDSELLRGWKLLPCSVNPLIAEQRTSEHCFPTIDLNYRAKLLDLPETCIHGTETITILEQIYSELLVSLFFVRDLRRVTVLCLHWIFSRCSQFLSTKGANINQSLLAASPFSIPLQLFWK